MEKNVSVGSRNSACACPSWLFPTDPKSYPFLLDSNYLRQNLQTWRQWFLPSSFPIDTGLKLHPVFPKRSLRDAPPTHICCGPSGLGGSRIHSEGRRIVRKGWWSHHISHCYVQWWYLRCYIWARDAQKRSACNCHIVLEVRGINVILCT